MAYKDGQIIINEFQKGIGESPYTGFADVRNCDIQDPQGVLKIALAPTKISASTVVGLPTWATSRTESDHYFGGYQDTNIYSISVSTVDTVSGSSITGGSTGGAWWKDYLIVSDYGSSGEGKLDAYDGSTWDNDFADIEAIDSVSTSRFTTPMLSSQDGILYGATGRYVWSLLENTSQNFDPTSGATFTFTSQALDLAEQFNIESLADLGSSIAIGASILRGGILFEGRDGRIFFWDRGSTDTQTEIQLDNGGVRQMVSRNGIMILSNGRHGDYLITNGTSVEPLKRIGSLKKNPTDADGEIFPEAKSFVNDEYLFGISSNDTNFTPAGVYGYKNGAWRFLEISTGEVGENGDLNIGVIHKKDNNKFFVGWEDNGTYGIDEFGYLGYRYTGYKARVDSQIYQVGNARNKKSFQYLDIHLARNLASGQGVKVSYRENQDESFTEIGTFDFDTYGAMNEISAPAHIQDVTTVQIRVELTTGANSTTTPELVSVVIS